MMKRMRGGFTMLEVVIVLALVAILATLILPPIVSSLIVVQRESSMLNMFRAADRAMGEISSALRPAILPMVTDVRNVCPGGGTPNASFMEGGFQETINSPRGFGFNGNGCAWSTLFVNGTNYVPFTIPVFFGATQNPTDKDQMPFLGMILPGSETTVMGTTYTVGVDAFGNPQYLPNQNPAAGNERSLHRAFATLNPNAFGTDSADMTTPIHAASLAFPDAQAGYAVIRFVPYRNPGTNAVRILSEATMNFDLNADGLNDDTFALGHLEIVFFDPSLGPTGQHPKRILTPPMVLQQINTGDASYVPIFRLVSWGGTANPGSVTWTPPGAAGLNRTGFAMVVSLLLFDQFNQTTPLAFNRGNRPYLVRRFESVVELRNMSRP